MRTAFKCGIFQATDETRHFWRGVLSLRKQCFARPMAWRWAHPLGQHLQTSLSNFMKGRSLLTSGLECTTIMSMTCSSSLKAKPGALTFISRERLKNLHPTFRFTKDENGSLPFLDDRSHENRFQLCYVSVPEAIVYWPLHPLGLFQPDATQNISCRQLEQQNSLRLLTISCSKRT